MTLFYTILALHHICDYHMCTFTGVTVAFDPSVVTVDEGSPGSVCAIITNGTIDRSVSIRFNVLENTGTASTLCE